MAIDTEIQETLKNHTRIKSMRRGGSPEPSCQLPTAPAYICLIPLTQGKFTIVDKKNYKWLNQWKWCAATRGKFTYAVRWVNNGQNGTTIRMHRQILNCKKGEHTDHINHNTIDNRVNNLRKCSIAQNQYNKIPKGGSSKYKGVSLSRKKWRVSINYRNTRYELGYFDSEIVAAKAYDAKALELFGEFAYTNF